MREIGVIEVVKAPEQMRIMAGRPVHPESIQLAEQVLALPEGDAVKIFVGSGYKCHCLRRKVRLQLGKHGVSMLSRTDGLGNLYMWRKPEGMEKR